MREVAALILVAAGLAACETTPPPTAGDACRSVAVPAPYAVRADTPKGQVWVNTTIEKGVRVCGFKRPPVRVGG